VFDRTSSEAAPEVHHTALSTCGCVELLLVVLLVVVVIRLVVVLLARSVLMLQLRLAARPQQACTQRITVLRRQHYRGSIGGANWFNGAEQVA
jgi:hypothetical protein